jgi:hypothetical protein
LASAPSRAQPFSLAQVIDPKHTPKARTLLRRASSEAQNREETFAVCGIGTCPLELHCCDGRKHECSCRGLQLGPIEPTRNECRSGVRISTYVVCRNLHQHRLWQSACMKQQASTFENDRLIECLIGQALLCERIASLCAREDGASKFKKLSENCRRAAEDVY